MKLTFVVLVIFFGFVALVIAQDTSTTSGGQFPFPSDMQNSSTFSSSGSTTGSPTVVHTSWYENMKSGWYGYVDSGDKSSSSSNGQQDSVKK